MATLLGPDALRSLLTSLLVAFRGRGVLESENPAQLSAELTLECLSEFGSYRDNQIKDLFWDHLIDEEFGPMIQEYLSLRQLSGKLKKRLARRRTQLEKSRAREVQERLGYRSARLKQIAEYESRGADFYPHKFFVTHRVPDFIKEFGPDRDPILANGETLEDQTVRVAGRVVSLRRSGQIVFCDIHGEGLRLQLLAMNNRFQVDSTCQVRSETSLSGSDDPKVLFREFFKLVARGDIVGAEGVPGRSETGELSLFVVNVRILSPCLLMLPKGPGSFSNPELRFRERYCDMIVRPDTRRIFLTRAKVLSVMRRFLEDRGFVEVETPVLQMTHGGATARPFETHHHELNRDMFLRVAPELFLKECVIAGIDRVYEIGKSFRNEGIDHKHNPEFTSCEFYWAYADYNDLMTLTEQLVSTVVFETTGSYQLSLNLPGEDEPRVVDFAPPWTRVKMIDEIERVAGERLGDPSFKIPRPLHRPENQQFLEDLLPKINVECSPPLTIARMIDELAGELIESKCVNPTFLIEHPMITSPLAKWHREIDDVTERFEVMCCRFEICNAYTELNCPRTQRRRFQEQVADREAGDAEAQVPNEEFCHALEYGLPPTAGWGLGIDRLTMIICNQFNIKEVILFPAMKPRAVTRLSEKVV